MTAGTSGNRTDPTFRWIALSICLYAAAAVAIIPVADQKLPEIPAITPFVMGGILATELATSFLLFVQFRDARTWSLLVLASAYLFSGLMAIGHLLTFPGAVLPGEVILGTYQSASWTFQFWTNGYASLVFASILLEAFAGSVQTGPEQIERTIVVAVVVALAAVVCCMFLATAMIGRMPPLMQGASWTLLNKVVNFTAVATMVGGISVILLVIRQRNPLYLWLGLALTATFFANILALSGGARYTVGWSAARLSWLVSACVLFLFFMYQFASQQRFLARARATLEQRVEERTADLVKTLKQRDLLLREVHHRVKNNLQVVDSLIAMEGRRLKDAAAQAALARLSNRVATLGLVHQQLMASENLEAVSMAPFLRKLVDNVASSFDAQGSGISVVVDTEPLVVHLDLAIPIGLITTELLSNAIKHADASRVSVGFRRDGDGSVVLVVSDDGRDADAGISQLASQSGIGSRIVEGLTRQLDGQMDIAYDAGMRVAIRMPLPETAS